MELQPLSKDECRQIRPGEALTLGTVVLVFTIVILAIAAYKLFKSQSANVTTPGGYKFEWKM